jgi:hypothetical protein
MFDNRYFLPRVASDDPRRFVERDPARNARRSLTRALGRRSTAQAVEAR